MRTTTPVVGVDTVTGGALLPSGIRLDSAAWFAWLEAPTTTSFAYPLLNAPAGYIDGFVTVRKERRTRGSVYWTAYWHVGRRLRKVYLGRAERLTAARLQAVAATLRAQVMGPGTTGQGAPPPRKEQALPVRD